MKFESNLNALTASVGGFLDLKGQDLGHDELSALPIGDFHEDPKKIKTLGDLYQHTELDEATKTDLAIRVESFARVNIGMSYRVMTGVLTMLKIAESNRMAPEVIETLHRAQAWAGRIMHEGGSLSGLTETWEAFWLNFNQSCRPWQPMVYFPGESLEKRFMWFKNREDLKDFVGEAGSRGLVYYGLDAALVVVKDLLAKENTLTDVEWGVLHSARMVAILMGQIEAQRDASRMDGKPLANSDRPAPLGLPLTLGELALVAGVIGRGSKGILSQTWNREAVLDADNPGNFASRLQMETIDKAFPNPCLTRQMLLSIKNLHARLQVLGRKAKEEEEDAIFGF